MEVRDIPCSGAVTAIVVILLLGIYSFFKNRNVLPGPKGVPFLGVYPFLNDGNVKQKLEEYKKEYGDLFSFNYGGKLFINLGSVKAIREVHLNNSDCFANRFRDYNVLVYMLDKGVTMTNGEPWKVLRKYFIQRFRDYGLYTIRDNMAGPVYDSLNATIEDLNSMNGQPVNVINLLSQRCAVTMRKIIFGEGGISDQELQEISINYSESLDGMMGVNLLLMGPLARLVFLIHPRCRRSLKRHQVLWNVIYSCTKKIEHSMDEEHPSCIIEDYYKEKNERRRNNDPTSKIFTDGALIDSLLQFVGDGIVGVAAFIASFLFALVEHPEEQDKLYAELMDVIGPNRQPVLEDKPNLPYVNAFINEVLRECTFFTMFPSLECSKETTIRGYKIPKGSVTLQNFFSANHDPNTFEDPDTFNPARYMPDSGKPKVEPPVLFGIGKRSCFGELFVMTQVFLFLTTIVKNFRITSAKDELNQTTANDLVTGQLELLFSSRAES